VNYSLNEIEALAKKAARGVGYSWGLSEEAAKSTRWLCRHGFDGCAALAGLLGRMDHNEMCPWPAYTQCNFAANIWQPQGGAICPIIIGATLADRAFQSEQSAVSIDAIVEPLLLLFFAAVIAHKRDTFVCIYWSNGWVRLDSDAVVIAGGLPQVQENVSIKINHCNTHEENQETSGSKCSLYNRSVPIPTDLANLEQFAARTYAPASEQSRLTGAGAGLSDND